MTTLNIPFTRIEANPFRDIENYVIDRGVVDDIKNSIEKSKTDDFEGFWENFGVRVKPGTMPEAFTSVHKFIEHVQPLSPDQQLAYYEKHDVVFQQDSGHHRSVAARECGIEVINVHVRDWSDDHMLVVMALENQESFRARPLTALETINQVVNRMQSQLDSADSWKEFQSMGMQTFKTAKQFANAKSQGIGIKSVKSYLGDNWSDMYIRASLSALKQINAGYYDLHTLQGFPTVDAIGGFGTLVTAFEKAEVPLGLLQVMATECANYIVAKDRTGNSIRAAAKQFDKNQNNPISFLSNESLSPLKWEKYLKSLDLGDYDVDVLTAGGSEKWIELAKKVKESIQKDVETEEKKAAFDREVEAKAEADGISEDDARAILEADQVEATEPEADEEEGGLLDGLPDIGEAPTTSPADEAAAIATLLGSSLQNIAPQFAALRGKLSDINGDGGEIFFQTLSDTFDSVTLLMAEHTSFKDIRARITQLSKM